MKEAKFEIDLTDKTINYILDCFSLTYKCKNYNKRIRLTRKMVEKSVDFLQNNPKNDEHLESYLFYFGIKNRIKVPIEKIRYILGETSE